MHFLVLSKNIKILLLCLSMCLSLSLFNEQMLHDKDILHNPRWPPHKRYINRLVTDGACGGHRGERQKRGPCSKRETGKSTYILVDTGWERGNNERQLIQRSIFDGWRFCCAEFSWKQRCYETQRVKNKDCERGARADRACWQSR